jgi:polar amino acid transport system substrate-binding protein
MSRIARRSFLKRTGATASTLVIAGCLGDGGGDSSTTGTGTEQIIAGTAPGFPPFEMKRDGELVGFDIDLLNAVVEQSDGYKLESWKTFKFESLIPALTHNKIDVIAAAMTITDKRDKTLDFTDPYYNADQSIIVRKDGSFTPSKLKDLSGHPIGAQSGTTGENIAKELVKKGIISKSNYKTYNSYVLAVQDLQNGNIDAVIVDNPVAKTFVQNRPVKIAFTTETGERYGFGIRNDANDLQKALNEGLAAVKDSGKYEKIRNEWFGSKTPE